MMKVGGWKNLLYGAIFAAMFAYVFAFGSSVVATRIYPEWAGSLVCGGRVEWIAFKQMWYCFASSNDFVSIQDAMFWAVFRRALIFAIPAAFLFTFGLMNLMMFVYRRREAIGFQ